MWMCRISARITADKPPWMASHWMCCTHMMGSQAPSVWNTGQNSWNDRYTAVTFFTLTTARTLPATTSSWYSMGCKSPLKSFATWHNACAHAGHVSTISCNNMWVLGSKMELHSFASVSILWITKQLSAGCRRSFWMRWTASLEISSFPNPLRALFQILTAFASVTPDSSKHSSKLLWDSESILRLRPTVRIMLRTRLNQTATRKQHLYISKWERHLCNRPDSSTQLTPFFPVVPKLRLFQQSI